MREMSEHFYHIGVHYRGVVANWMRSASVYLALSSKDDERDKSRMCATYRRNIPTDASRLLWNVSRSISGRTRARDSSERTFSVFLYCYFREILTTHLVSHSTKWSQPIWILRQFKTRHIMYCIIYYKFTYKIQIMYISNYKTRDVYS